MTRRALSSRWLLAAGCAASIVMSGRALAQGRADSARPAPQRGFRAAPRAGRGANPQQALQRAVRQRFAEVERQRLNLNDEQMRHLQESDRKYTQQRNQVVRQERDARLGLKAALEDTAHLDQTKISQYLDQLVEAQRRRADVLDAEQKELSTFLTPQQRAMHLALHEQLQQRIQQLRQQPPPIPPAGGDTTGGRPPDR